MIYNTRKWISLIMYILLTLFEWLVIVSEVVMLFLFPGALELWLYLLPKILIRFSPPSVKSLTRLSWTGKEFRFFLQYLHIKNMAIPRTRKAITTTTANITTSFPKSINICNQTENEYWQEFNYEITSTLILWKIFYHLTHLILMSHYHVRDQRDMEESQILPWFGTQTLHWCC